MERVTLEDAIKNLKSFEKTIRDKEYAESLQVLLDEIGYVESVSNPYQKWDVVDGLW